MNFINYLYRVTIEQQGHQVVVFKQTYWDAYHYCGNYFIQQGARFYWSGNAINENIPFSQLNKKRGKSDHCFFKFGFYKKTNKDLQIWIDPIFPDTENKYPISKNAFTKHIATFNSGKTNWQIEVKNYNKAFVLLVNYLIENFDYKISDDLLKVFHAYSKKQTFNYGEHHFKNEDFLIMIMPV